MSTPQIPTPETDAASFMLTWRNSAYYVSKPNLPTMEVVPVETSEALERRAISAEARLSDAREALAIIYAWNSFPNGGQWEDGREMSYGTAYGSCGERDYMRGIAFGILESTKP